MAHFTLRIAASRLCIFDRMREVEHKGCKDQLVSDVACRRVTLVGPRAVAHDVAVMRVRARVHVAWWRALTHGAWALM
ncbi:hypothetical protein HanRHA438_Chr15g0688721 [Helianthus annuus]|nr:hypothetical protein HanRHA438_Chr15g0688721 [Helianthus annuus]